MAYQLLWLILFLMLMSRVAPTFLISYINNMFDASAFIDIFLVNSWLIPMKENFVKGMNSEVVFKGIRSFYSFFQYAANTDNKLMVDIISVTLV